MITKPQNVLVMRDIMCNGYVAGGNCKFFGSGGKKVSKANPVTADRVQEEVSQRLAYADDLDSDYCSMLAFLSSYDEVEEGSRDQVISISDRLLPWEVTKNAGTSKSASGFPGGQAAYQVYRDMYNLNQIHFGEDVRAAENMEFIANVRFKAFDLNSKRSPIVNLKTTLTPFVCLLTLTGLDEQRHLRARPAPQVQPVLAELLRALPRPGPLWPRRHPGRTHHSKSNPCLHFQPPFDCFISILILFRS